MAAKDVKFSVDARDKMLRGVDTLAHADQAHQRGGKLRHGGGKLPDLVVG